MTTRTVLQNGIKAKGRSEYAKFVAGEKLSPQARIRAMCYDCQGGYADGAADCSTADCPLYAFHPYNKNAQKREISEKQRQDSRENLRKIRDSTAGIKAARGSQDI